MNFSIYIYFLFNLHAVKKKKKSYPLFLPPSFHFVGININMNDLKKILNYIKFKMVKLKKSKISGDILIIDHKIIDRFVH